MPFWRQRLPSYLQERTFRVLTNKDYSFNPDCYCPKYQNRLRAVFRNKMHDGLGMGWEHSKETSDLFEITRRFAHLIQKPLIISISSTVSFYILLPNSAGGLVLGWLSSTYTTSAFPISLKLHFSNAENELEHFISFICTTKYCF